MISYKTLGVNSKKSNWSTLGMFEISISKKVLESRSVWREEYLKYKLDKLDIFERIFTICYSLWNKVRQTKIALTNERLDCWVLKTESAVKRWLTIKVKCVKECTIVKQKCNGKVLLK